MPIPAWVDFLSAERSAAVMARGLLGASDAWPRLLANAQAILGARTDGEYFQIRDSYLFSEWQDLVAAARILDLAATELGLGDQEDRKAAAILAACAFGMSGTAVSATAVIRRHELLGSDLSPGELTSLALSSPILCRQILPWLTEGSAHRTCVENVTAFLGTGGENQFSTADNVLQQMIFDEPAAWEGYLLRLSRLSLAHVGRLATAKVLAPYRTNFPEGYLEWLAADSPVLLPSQYEAVIDRGILEPDRNLLITLPAGTGKTLLGELSLFRSLGRDPGLVCYIAPYVALGRQVADRIRRHAPAEVRIHRLVGAYKEPDPLDPENYPEVLVATPERFDAMMRFRPDLLSYIRCVVFDEAHMIGNGQRGVRLEGILTRMRLAALRGDQVPRFVLLSAVLSNADALANWIGIEPVDVVRGTWRPTAKRLLRWKEEGKLQLHAGDDPMRERPAEILGEKPLQWPTKGFYPSAKIGVNRKQGLLALQNVAYLAESQYQQYQQPVLCVCSTRPKTRHLTAKVAQLLQLIEPLPQPIRIITNLIDQKHPYLRPLKDALLRGAAYHNSSLPHDIREGIERAVESRTLKVVAATTTLAEGVDLPFRTTILSDWLMFDGSSDRPMDSLLFKNIAGRCGRAGQFTEGDTIIFDNPVGDPQLTSPARRPDLHHQIFFSDDQPLLASAISKLDSQTAVATIGSQLLAAISENPGAEDLAPSFISHSFAHETENARLAADRISVAFQGILDESDGQPLAVAASPARLTPFGEAANSGGLSPETARKLRNTLSGFSQFGSSRDDLVKIGVALLKALSNAAEQTNTDLRKAVANPKSRPAVRADELDSAFDLWLAGEPLDQIFAALSSNKRSSRKPNLSLWLEGVSEDSSWTDQFANFYDFMNQCMSFFLPWVLNAAQHFAEIDDQPERPWREWARFAERGVDTTWAVRLIDEDVITERSDAREIGRRLDYVMSGERPSIEQAQQHLAEALGDNRYLVNGILNWMQRYQAFSGQESGSDSDATTEASTPDVIV